MMRIIMIAGIAGVLVGVLAGFLWWGTAVRRMQADLQSLKDQQVAAEVAQEQLKGVRAQLKRTQDELASERERRARLEVIVSEGRK